MAATPQNIVERRHGVQYDGTNSGDIDALFSLNTLSESGGVWMFESPPGSSTYTVNTNDWIVYAQNMAFATHSPTAFVNFYRCNAECADVESLDVQALQEAVETLEGEMDALQAEVDALGGVSIRSVGVAAVPTLLLGASATVAVQLNPAMADSSYTAKAFKFASVSLVDLQINSVTIVDADTVNVNVENTGLVTLSGASVLVTATD